MLIPLRTDRPPKRRPVVTETLIIVNLLVYLAGLVGHYSGWFSVEQMVALGHFDPQRFNPLQLITYQFLHSYADVLHVVFNMLFLWVFGSAVEDRMGRVSFLLFFLMGGMFAGVAHMIVSIAPVIGASGSVAAVTGAFLALFPRSKIQILFFFFIIGVYAIPALWFILFYLVIDLMRAAGTLFGGSSGVAYAAHLGGYVFGFAVAVAMLGLNMIKHEEFDILYLYKQARRRAAFRAMNRQSAGAVWDQPVKKHASAPAPVAADQDKADKRSEARREDPHAAKRNRIRKLISQHQLDRAAKAYSEALNDAPDLYFRADQQLDLANQLYAQGDAEHAAAAYELFLDRYTRSAEAPRVRLLLATVYARHLSRQDRARELLESVRDSLRDENDARFADELWQEISPA